MPIRWLALTGTPGVGKSTLSRHLRSAGIRVVDGKRFAMTHKCVVGYDRARRSRIVDTKKVATAIRRLPPTTGVSVLEAHWAHEVDAMDAVLVLRLHPRKLAARLRRRRYSKAKVRENVEAEALDIILQESVRRFGTKKVGEFDTTDVPKAGVARSVRALLDDVDARLMKFEIGRHEWAEEILRWS